MRIRMSHFTTQMEVYFCGLIGRCADSVVLIFRFTAQEALVSSFLRLEKTQLKRCNLLWILKLGRLGVRYCFTFQSGCLLLRGSVVMQQEAANQKKIHTGASCFSSSLASVYFLNSFYIIEATHVPCIIPNKSIKMKIRICKPITQWQPCYFRGCILICFGLLMHAH